MNTEKSVLDVQSEIQVALQRLPSALHRLGLIADKLPNDLKPLANDLKQAMNDLNPLVPIAPPAGCCVEVSLRHGDAKKSRQVKRNAPADSWSPDTGLVSISYGPSVEATEAPSDIRPTAAADSVSPSAGRQEDPVRDLLVALAKAEDDPQLGFVSLKWFRDSYLPQQGFAWADDGDGRQRVLVDAIHRMWILTSKVPNPKNPLYPVTAIRVNRPLAEVRKILDKEAGFDSLFAPITIAGERLSETVLRERR